MSILLDAGMASPIGPSNQVVHNLYVFCTTARIKETNATKPKKNK